MAHEPAAQTEVLNLSRRCFIRDAATVASVACLAPGALLGCQAEANRPASASANVEAEAMDQSLEMMAGLGPLGNHGPMAAEALIAIGRSDRVVPFVEAYKKRFSASYPAARQAVSRENWRDALGDGARIADWTMFFTRELEEAAWPEVLDRWTAALSPGLAAAAGHGLLRTAHAVRSLSVRNTSLRRRELSAGLGYWAAYYQALPETATASTAKIKPAEAISRIPLLPEEKRARGSIMAGVRSLSEYPPFAVVANLVEATGKAEQFLSELTEAFATVYVQKASQRSFLSLLHAVTSLTGLRSLLPYLSPATTRSVLRYGWQTGAALYSIAGTGLPNNPVDGKEINRAELIERAAGSLEEHAIKFTEACLREYALNPKTIYLQAARDGLGRL